MSAWLAHPLVQSIVVPLAVGFLVAWLLRPHGGVLAGLGFAAAFGAAVYLIVGLQWSPVTSTRKIVLAAAAAVIVGLVIELYLRDRAIRFAVLAIAGAAAALWLLWPLIQRKEVDELWMFAAPALAYAAWLPVGLEGLNSRPANLVAGALALAAGTAFAAFLGASALLAQLGGAVAAAVGGYALVFLISGEFEPRSVFAVPVAAATALLGLAAVSYARMPPAALIALAAIPALAQLPVPKGWGVLQRGLLVLLYTLPAAAVAVTLTWRITGSPAF